MGEACWSRAVPAPAFDRTCGFFYDLKGRSEGFFEHGLSSVFLYQSCQARHGGADVFGRRGAQFVVGLFDGR